LLLLVGDLMAHVYPYGTTRFGTYTEEIVYNALSKLSDKHYVFYDNRWTSRGLDIQTDFIIAKEGASIQILEVKGGQWSRLRGQLLCNGRPPHQDPVNQVIKQKKALIDKLRNSGSFDGFLPISHAIAFPDTPGEAFDGCVDLPPILDSRSIHYIQDWISTQMETAEQQFRQTVCDEKMINHLKKTLAHDWSASLQDYLNTQDAQLIKQTQQIFAAYDGLLNNRRVGIQGCAGSGKTWLMIRLANKFAQDKSIKNILVTCKNIALSEWLVSQLTSNKNKVDVFPLVEQMREEVKASGLHNCDITNMDKSERLEFYKTILPELYFTNLLDSRETKYDVILVDEAQTFNPDYWDCIGGLLRDPKEGILHTFSDDYQRIYNEKDEFKLQDQLSLSLSVNLRNSRSIHDHAIKFIKEDIKINKSSVTGAPVYFIPFDDDMLEITSTDKLCGLLDDLLQNNSICQENITILTTRRKQDCFISKYVDEDERLGNHKFTSQVYSKFGITCTSAQKFRGLENQIIILGDIQSGDFKQLNYIAASRAKLMLFLLVSQNFINKYPEYIEGCREYTGEVDPDDLNG